MVVPLVHADSQALSELMDPREWSSPSWSLVCVPLTMSGQVVGTLSAYFRASSDPDFSGLLDVLEVVASLLTPALSRLEPRRSSAPSRSTPWVGNGASCNMIGDSPAMRPVYEQIAQVARTNATALIRGPSGTGKELVAHAIHTTSPRSRQPFVKVNCAALPETLFESELFGHERGAFTGAFARKKGRFELAQGGTLFLDEVGELSLATQAKLLRVLQFREFERLGSADTLHTDVRVIAATNKDMEQAVAAGTFRKDLYYRLNVFTITLPSLKDRPEDIPALAEHFLTRYAQEHRGSTARLSREALDALIQYPFPGNVRELENVIERAVVVCDGSVILEQHLPDNIRNVSYESTRQHLTLAAAVGQLESRMLEEALQHARGNAARAARALGTTERVVRYKASKYGIDCTRFR
jgi:Nif-specific regulatory protein